MSDPISTNRQPGPARPSFEHLQAVEAEAQGLAEDERPATVAKSTAAEALGDTFAGRQLGADRVQALVDRYADAATADDRLAGDEFGYLMAAVDRDAAVANQMVPTALIRSQVEALNAAQAKVTERENALALAMAGVGPALAPEQQAQYMKAWRERHQADFDALAEAQRTLGATLREQEPNIVKEFGALPGERGDDFRRELLAAYGKLGPDQAPVLMNFVTSALGDSRIAERGVGGGIVDQLLVPRLPDMHASLLVQHAGDPAGATEALARALTPALERYASRLDAGMVGDQGKKVTDIAGNLQGLADVFKGSAGPQEAARRLTTIIDGAAGPAAGGDALKRSIGVLAVASGALVGASAAEQGNYLKAVENFAAAGGTAADLIKDLGIVAKRLPAAAHALGKVAPVLGAVGNGLAAWQKKDEAMASGDRAVMAAAIGDATAMVGGLILIGVGSAGVGLALVAIGTLASVGFSSYADRVKAEAAKADVISLLSEPQHGVRLDPALARQLAELPPHYLEDLAKHYGMDERWLPGLIQDEHLTGLLTSVRSDGVLAIDQGPFERFARAAFGKPGGGVDGQAYVDFLRGQAQAAREAPGAGFSAREAGEYGSSLLASRMAADAHVFDHPSPPRTRAEWQDRFTRYAEYARANYGTTGEGGAITAMAEAALAQVRDAAGGFGQG